ncbi:hypothetical protein [Falsiroseomonas oryzae]|uniref:hypothetical protein n=1 Tax=Falsiroseomonas oryzae TaxID=2766473 RepID=UPI0022EB4B50|nr:hypothetical protein [Roseomonas sp. MO-31]
MTSTERSRACRARQRARRQAERKALGAQAPKKPAPTSTERANACRARQRARKLAERPELADAAELTRITSGVLAAPAQPTALPEPPPLPDDPNERAAAMQVELEASMRQVLLDPAAPPAARVAAGRSLAELAGLLKTRAPAPDPNARAYRSATDPELLEAQARATREEARQLREAISWARMMN